MHCEGVDKITRLSPGKKNKVFTKRELKIESESQTAIEKPQSHVGCAVSNQRVVNTAKKYNLLQVSVLSKEKAYFGCVTYHNEVIIFSAIFSHLQ